MKTQVSMHSLYHALVEAHEKEGKPPPAPPTERGKWSNGTFNRLDWINGLFGSLEVRSDSCDISSDSKFSGLSTWAALGLGQTPDMIDFNLKIQPVENVRVLHARGGVVTDVTDGNIPSFDIGIDWRSSKEGPVPSTRRPDNDNFDLVFLRTDKERSGMYAQLQISVSTRDRKFWLAAQDIFSGQIVRTNGENAAKLPIMKHPVGSHFGLAVPLYPENAHPSNDYLRIFRRMGPKVVDYAVGCGAVVPLSECVVAQWEPVFPTLPGNTGKDGWKSGCVGWYNMVTGTGESWFHGLAPDEQQPPLLSCKLHFSNILDDRGRSLSKLGKFPILQPMSAIALKYERTDRGPSATEIRVL